MPSAYALGSYAAAKAAQVRLDDEHRAAAAALKAIPGVGSGTMGLTPDSIKFGPDYRGARRRVDIAFESLRRFNQAFKRRYARQIADDARAARRAPVVHQGYRIDTLTLRGGRVTAHDNVRVYPQSYFLYPLYMTSTIEDAIRWVDAFVKGEAWAENVRLRHRI